MVSDLENKAKVLVIINKQQKISISLIFIDSGKNCDFPRKSCWKRFKLFSDDLNPYVKIKQNKKHIKFFLKSKQVAYFEIQKYKIYELFSYFDAMTLGVVYCEGILPSH